MNTFEVNKFAGAFLGTLLFILVIGYVGNALVPIPKQEHHGEAAGHGAPAAATASAPVVPDVPIAERLKAADLAAGEQAFAKKCTQCHTTDKGGANKVGPNLFNVVGGPHAHTQGFNYSDAMKNAAGDWSYENLDAFIANPKAAVKGTKMTYVGSKDGKERANLIAFLRTKSDSPKPLP